MKDSAYQPQPTATKSAKEAHARDCLHNHCQSNGISVSNEIIAGRTLFALIREMQYDIPTALDQSKKLANFLEKDECSI